MVTDKSNFQKKFKKILRRGYKIKKFQRLEAYINNKKIKELALNEFYVASEKDYHTARYFLIVRGKKERQKSSGVLIATPAGSNAWIKSAGGKILSLNTNKFEYLVREPYCGKISAKCSLVNNVLNNNEKIEVIFEVGNGIVIADSLSKEHRFKVGDKVICNGYEGAIGTVLTGQLKGMYDVRLMSGIVCVDGKELVPLVPLKAMKTAKQEEVNWRVAESSGNVTMIRSTPDRMYTMGQRIAMVWNRDAEKAELIVRACNSHKDLLAAAKVVERELTRISLKEGQEAVEDRAMLLIRAAIAKATPPERN